MNIYCNEKFLYKAIDAAIATMRDNKYIKL